jgi:secreted trypsin-like serine protease
VLGNQFNQAFTFETNEEEATMSGKKVGVLLLIGTAVLLAATQVSAQGGEESWMRDYTRLRIMEKNLKSIAASKSTIESGDLERSLTPRAGDEQIAGTSDNPMRDYVRLRIMEKNLKSIAASKSTIESGDLERSLTPRIVGGQNAGTADNPFQVALLDRNIQNTQNAQFCGGTLIRENVIVTAAHCSDFVTAAGVQVLTGTRRLDGTGIRRNVTRVTIHPQWNAGTFDSDVAVWEMATNATGIPVASLATDDGNVGNNLLATGWGALTQGGSSPIDLQRVQLPLVDRANCNDANSYNGQITGNMMCAGRDSGGIDTCQGDSGGPLSRGPNNSLLTGITSWGFGCAQPDLFGVYTRVSQPEIRDFILDQTQMEHNLVGYVLCASENQSCSFSGTKNVAYGANGKFNYKTATNGIACNNTTFGDPIVGVVKACYIGPESYSHCATENGRCNFSGTKNVAYGANGKFSYKTATNGIACNNTTFGDPIVGVVKACYIGPKGYNHCAAENGRCSFSGTKKVAYGANGKFSYKTATNGIACNNTTFGDPIVGVVKACYIRP